MGEVCLCVCSLNEYSDKVFWKKIKKAIGSLVQTPLVRISIFERLHGEGLLSEDSLTKIRANEAARLFSIHWELKTLLYLGVLLLTGGLSILVYKHIDTIGHTVILTVIGAVCAGSFLYCERKKLPFSYGKVPAPNGYFDYILLLGCLTLLTFIAYLQAQYTVFGEAYGLATFIPMVILFFCAYYFDHLGVLSLAITNLAAWMGVAITPLKIFNANNFHDAQIIFAGLLLGVILVAAAQLIRVKKHFSFTYLNFGMNVLFVSCLAGMFYFEDTYLVWLLPLALLVFYFYRQALRFSSFYFMLMIVLYAYVGLAYAVMRLIIEAWILIPMYLMGSAIGAVLLLINLNKKLKVNARIQ